MVTNRDLHSKPARKELTVGPCVIAWLQQMEAQFPQTTNSHTLVTGTVI